MSTKIKLLLFFVLISLCANAQVKIGENPNIIDSASIVELESTDKAFVLTRLTTAQMQAITPLNGAVVYNTDTQCVHYYNGLVWTNLCDGNSSSSFSFNDNGDGTITLSDGNGNNVTFNGAAQTISTLADNGDGTYTYTNENGLETVISIAVTDNQNLQTDNTPGNISIDNGNAIAINVDDADADDQNEIQTLDYTSGVLTLSNDPNATTVDLSGFDQDATDDFSGSFNDLTDLPVNLDTDATDDFNTGISFDGINLRVSDAGGDVSTDISGLAYDDTAIRADVDQNELDADNAIAAVDTKIDNHILADEDVSATNELSDLSLSATNILTLTNAEAGATGVDLSGYVSTDDQNLESATLSGASELGINIEGGNDVTVDLSPLEESADITAVQDDVDQNEVDADNAIAAVDTKIDDHIIADEDVSATNELSDLSLSATNILTLTNAEAGATGVDLSGYVSTDDQNLESATLSGISELAINIEGGNDVTVDLSALEESADITAVQDDVDQNEVDADNAIAAVDTKIDDHILADEDVSATNELSDLSLDASNILTLTNPATGTNEVDLSGFVSTDDQNLESATLSGTSELAINIEGGNDVTVDLSALEESADITAVQDDVDQNEVDADNAIAAVDTKIDDHILADEDVSATNELSDLSLDASNILTLTNPATGTNEVDLSGFVSTDDQNLESATLSGTSELAINIEGGNDVSVDLSALEESADITAVDNKVDAHILADEDISATNELSDLSLSATNILTLTNAEAGATGVDLSGYKLTGTTGSIFFADTDGTPTEENSELFWDNGSNSLGIGTNSPSNKLEVSGAIRSQGMLNSNGTVGEPSYRFSNDTNTGMYRPAADEISFSVGGIEALKIEETSNKTSVIINETLELEGTVLDENDSAGTVGQVLSATATGTEWVDNYNPVKVIGKISSTGTITKATTGVTITRISIGYYRVTLPTGSVSDADYIIQLSQPGRNGVGNDDPGISYSNQTTTSFEVIIGDNDNGGTDRSRFDSEFMFTVLDL